MRTAEALAPREHREAGIERFERRPRASEPQPGERHTVVITGRPHPVRRRSATRAQIVARPDRVALWAFLLGLMLVLVAAATAHAAPL
jgi:hypothetical protein